MALIKTAETPAGAQGAYWRVINVHLDPVKNIMHVVVGLYVSKEARDAGKIPLWRLDNDFSLPPLAARSSKDIVELAYECVKVLPEFAGATND